MGYYSVILVLNDMLGQIEKDSHFGAKVFAAINRFGPPGTSKERMFRNDIGHNASVVQVDHADTASLLLVGGNQGRVLGVTSNQGRIKDPHDEREVLRLILKRLGYELRGKRKDSPEMDIVQRVGRISEGDQLRDALTEARRENLALRQALQRAERMLAAAQSEIGNAIGDRGQTEGY